MQPNSNMLTSARMVKLFLVVILALLLVGCSSTKISDSWEASNIDEPPAKKILLIAIAKDPVTRRFFEEHFVAEASEKGVEVIPSFKFAPHATDLDEKEEIIKILKESGADGVLIAQLRSIDEKSGYVPNRLSWFPDAGSSALFYDYYFESYRAIHRPGYIGSDSYFRMQLRYFSARSEKMLWAGNTVTKNPRSVVGTIEQIADKTIGELRSADLVQGGGLF